LKGLVKRLKELAQMELTRDQLLLKLGAAKSQFPAAWRLVTLQVPAPEAILRQPNLTWSTTIIVFSPQSLSSEPFVASRAADKGEGTFETPESFAKEIKAFYHLTSAMSCSNCSWMRSSCESRRLR
jgi:hypothetical protein